MKKNRPTEHHRPPHDKRSLGPRLSGTIFFGCLFCLSAPVLDVCRFISGDVFASVAACSKQNEIFFKKRKKILPRLMTAEPTHWGRFAAHNGPPFKKKKKWEPIFVWKIQSIRRLIEQVEKPMAMCTIGIFVEGNVHFISPNDMLLMILLDWTVAADNGRLYVRIH